MIVTLTPNPALDLTYHLSQLRVGATQRVPPAQVRAGGKAINVARVLHTVGIATQVIAPIGGHTGQALADDLASAAIPHVLLPTNAPTRSTVAIVAGSTTNFNETGTALSPQEWDQLLELVEAAVAASQTRMLVCSGSVPPQAPADLMARVVAIAHRHDTRCLIDTSGPHLLAAAEAGADLLKPNHHELRDIDALSALDPLTAARELAARSGGIVYASLGAAGLLRVPATGEVLHARLPEPLSGNTTGAGDAAVAAIADSDGRDDPATTLRRATAWSAAAVLAPLAGSITDPEPLLDQVVLETVTTTPDLKE